MRFYWLSCLVGLGFICCGPGTSDVTQQTKADVSSLKRDFTDSSLSDGDRKLAGVKLLREERGAQIVAERFISGDRILVQGLLDSLDGKDPRLASRLAGSLMEAVSGEEKLTYESILLRQGDDAVEPLVRIADESEDWKTVLQALDALGKLKATAGFPTIQKRLQDKNSWVRIGAAHALGELDAPEAIPSLQTALDDTVDTVVAAALVALGRTGDLRAVDSCLGMLSHGNPRVRSAAVSALGRLGQSTAVEFIRPLLSDPDSGVRYKAEQALEALRGDH